MKVLGIIFWMLAAMIVTGVFLGLDDNDNYSDDDGKIILLFIMMCGGWIFAAMVGIGVFIFKQLIKLPMFIAGFISSFRK